MAVQFSLTDVGRQAILDVEDLGLDLKLKHIAVSTHKYPTEDLAALTELDEQLGAFLLGGGLIEPASETIRLSAYIEPQFTAMIFTIGLLTEDGTLFAVASTTGTDPLLQLVTSITCIATLGIQVVDVDLSNVTIMIDPNSQLAVALMNQHIGHPNPHPQYAMDAAFQAHVTQNTLEHNVILSLLSGANTARANGDSFLLDLINGLQNSLASLYPKTIASGVLNLSCGDDGVVWGGSMLSATTGWDFVSPDIKNTLDIDLTNVRYSIIFIPEAAHEAWGSWRLPDGFHVGVWNRSGTRRVGWSGNVSWCVIETMPSNANEGNGNYVPGVYSFAIYPGSTKRIKLFGAGAGGGSSRLSTDSSTDATAGGDTMFLVGTTVITAAGGQPGTNGEFINDGAYTGGVGGTGGTVSYTGSAFVVEVESNGADGGGLRENHQGGSSGRFNDYSRGGNGGDGVGVVASEGGYAFGGGGGEGAYIEFTYTNTTSEIKYASLVVGAAGNGAFVDDEDTAVNNNGVIGNNGFATVSNP